MKKLISLFLLTVMTLGTVLFTSKAETLAAPAPILQSAKIDQVSNIDRDWENINSNTQPIYKAKAVMSDYVYFRVTTNGYSTNLIYSGSTAITKYATNYRSTPITAGSIVTGWSKYYKVPVNELVENNIQVYAISQVGTTKIWTNKITFDVE